MLDHCTPARPACAARRCRPAGRPHRADVLAWPPGHRRRAAQRGQAAADDDAPPAGLTLTRGLAGGPAHQPAHARPDGLGPTPHRRPAGPARAIKGVKGGHRHAGRQGQRGIPAARAPSRSTPRACDAFTPRETASSDALWAAVAKGELVSSYAAKLPLGDELEVSRAMALRLRVGALASFGLPGADLVVNRVRRRPARPAAERRGPRRPGPADQDPEAGRARGPRRDRRRAGAAAGDDHLPPAGRPTSSSTSCRRSTAPACRGRCSRPSARWRAGTGATSGRRPPGRSAHAVPARHLGVRRRRRRRGRQGRHHERLRRGAGGGALPVPQRGGTRAGRASTTRSTATTTPTGT